MSILLEHNKIVIKVIKDIERSSKEPILLEEKSEIENHKDEMVDLIENTVKIIIHLQKLRDPNLKKAKEICLKGLYPHLEKLTLKSTISFATIYQNILNGRIKKYKLD